MSFDSLTKETLLLFVETKLIPALFTLAVGFILYKFLLHFTEKAINKAKRIDKMLAKFIISVIRALLLLFIAMDVLSTLGISTKSIAGVLAGAGAAIALGLQNNLANLTSGLLIIFSRIFVQGEWIEINGYEGQVKSIDLMNTTIVTINNETVTIPNSNISSNTVRNYTRGGKRRLEIPIGVSYNSDLDVVRSALLQLVKDMPQVLKNEPMAVNVTSYDDSAISMMIYCWVQPADYLTTKIAILNNIKPYLDRAEVSIPFPQLDVHHIN